eukprot:c4140_g2_i1 orf=256-465(+)
MRGNHQVQNPHDIDLSTQNKVPKSYSIRTTKLCPPFKQYRKLPWSKRLLTGLSSCTGTTDDQLALCKKQ